MIVVSADDDDVAREGALAGDHACVVRGFGVGRLDVKAAYAETANYAGVIPGKGALAGDIVVVGAHYDHLGYGGEGSMKPNEHAIHPGADDNASGTAGVLQAASRLEAKLAHAANHRTMVFALFS